MAIINFFVMFFNYFSIRKHGNDVENVSLPIIYLIFVFYKMKLSLHVLNHCKPYPRWRFLR